MKGQLEVTLGSSAAFCALGCVVTYTLCTCPANQYYEMLKRLVNGSSLKHPPYLAYAIHNTRALLFRLT